MDQNAETNGCDDSPVAVGVSNHTEICSPKLDKQMTKSLSSQDSKKSRSAASNAKGGRGRRNAPTTPQNSTPATSPPSERRATRNIAQPLSAQQLQPSPNKPTRTLTAAERKATPKILTPTPISNAQSNKKSTQQQQQQPPILSLASSEGTPNLSQETASPNSRLSKHLQQQSPLHSSPPHLKSQKRGTKRQHREVLNAEDLASRVSKRVRLQHQPFQSPPPPTIIPAILRQQVIKTPEDKIVVFQRGEFLAVRNETGSFFVCRTAQNVYKSSKRFKIQWMSDKETDIYIPDFYDQTDFECVLTNLRLKRVDKNKWMLPPEERQRTLNILERALNVENGMDIAKLQVTTDGVDVSIVGKEDEEEIIRLQQEKLKEEHKPKPVTLIKNRGRPRRPELPIKTTRTTAAAAAASATSEKKVNKSSADAKVNLRLSEGVKLKLKEEESKVLYSEKTGKPVKKLKKIAERLHPNPKVTVYEKDPTFEMNVPIPYVSSSAHSKLLIRAILLKDMNMLQSYLKDTQKICSLNSYRSVDVKLTPLMYAVLEEDHRAI